MTLNKTLLSGLSAFALGIAAALGTAGAQDAAPAPQTELPAAQGQQTDDAKLKSFAVAFIEVTKVNQTYRPQIESAGSPEDQQRLRKEASEKMVEAVTEADGITVDEYNTIIEQAQADPDLAQRINGHIAEAVGTEPPAQQPAQQPAE